MKRFSSNLFVALLLISGMAEASDVPNLDETHRNQQVVRVGLVDTFTPNFYIDVYTPLIESLKKRLPQYTFVTNEIAHTEAGQVDVLAKQDFLIVSSHTPRMVPEAGLQQIATLRRGRESDVSRSVGAVFVVPTDSPIQSLVDMKGRSVAASAPWTFEGWMIPMGEIASHGFDPETFFQEVTYTEWNFPDVITLVTTGMTDVGILSTCELEQAIRTGVVSDNALRIIGQRPQLAPGGCACSTDLYPDMIFASSPSVDPNIVKEVTVALLSMPPNASGFDWLTNSRMQNVETLLQRLKVGPYSYLRNETFSDVVLRYRNEILLAFLLLLTLLAHHFRVNLLLKRRTEALQAEERARLKAAEALRQSKEKLDLIERAGMASQLAAMFAHEIKQPLTIITNYLSGMRIMMKRGDVNMGMLNDAVTHAEREAHRAADIVERVRSALKKETPLMLPVDVEAVIRSAGRTAQTVPLEIEMPKAPVYVLGDALELELILVNFIKNACRAVSQLEDKAPIRLHVDVSQEEVQIAVDDQGPTIDDEVFARLGKLTRSCSQDGMGFGLFISSSIAEAHCGHLTFKRRRPHGLSATLVLPRYHFTETPS